MFELGDRVRVIKQGVHVGRRGRITHLESNWARIQVDPRSSLDEGYEPPQYLSFKKKHLVKE